MTLHKHTNAVSGNLPERKNYKKEKKRGHLIFWICGQIIFHSSKVNLCPSFWGFETAYKPPKLLIINFKKYKVFFLGEKIERIW